MIKILLYREYLKIAFFDYNSIEDRKTGKKVIRYILSRREYEFSIIIFKEVLNFAIIQWRWL